MNYPEAIWPYSPFVKAGNFIYFSGQIWLDPESMELEETLWMQTQRVCKNISALCEAAWVKISDICKTTIFLTGMGDFQEVNEIYAQYFTHKPARSTLGVKELPKWALIEIECIAYTK